MSRLVIDMPHPPRELSPNAKAPLSARGALVAGVKKTVAKKRCRDMAMGIDDRTLDCAGIDRVHDLAKAGQVEIVFEERRGEDANKVD